MPIYQYEGQHYDIADEDPAAAKNKILAHLGKQPAPKAAQVSDVAPILSPEEVVTSQSGVVPSPVKTEAKPRPPSELAMGREFLEKGIPSGVVGVKSMVAGVDLLKDASLVGSALKNLNVYEQIDKGKITSLADAEGLGLPKDQIRMYLAAKTPEAKEQMKQNQQGIIDKRQGFVKEGLNLFKQYQAEAEKVKGVTPDVTDVRTVKDFGNWLAFNVGSGTVQLAPIILAALTTGGAGAAAIGVGMGVGETVGNRLEFIQNKVKSLPPEKQADEIEKYIRDTGDSSMAIGLASGALDLLGPVGAILRARAGKEGLKYLTKKEAAKAALKEAPKDIAKEGLTGGAQETIQIGGEYALKEQTGNALTEKNLKRIVNAAAAEAAGGLSGTTVSAGLKLAQAQKNQNEEAAQLAAIERDKITTALSQPGAMEKLAQDFQQNVDKFLTVENPKTGKLYTQKEAYEAAGDAILQGGILDVDTTTDSGAAKSSVPMSGSQGTTDTGPDATGRTDLGPDTTTAVAIEGGEGPQLDTLTPEPLDPELRQRALLKLMSFQDDLGTPPKPREVNALARDLGIEVKKGAKVPDTIQKIQSVLAPPETISGAAADVSTDTSVPTTPEVKPPIVDDKGAFIPGDTKNDLTKASAGFKQVEPDSDLYDEVGDATFISSFDVQPDEQGKGYGTKLLTSIVDWADSNGKRLALNPAASGNLNQEQLKDWYGRNGFEQVGDYMVREPAAQEVVVDQEAEAEDAAVENVETDEDLDNVDQLFGQPPKGKGGRKPLDRTPEQQAAAAQVRKAQQQAGRDSIDAITRAEKLFDSTENIDPDTFLDQYPTEEAAREAVAAITESRLSALTTAYGYTTGSSKKKKAGVRGAALLAKATPEEQNLAKQRYEDQQNIGKPSRAMMPKEGSTSDKTNLEFENFNNIKGAVNSILNSKTSTEFEKILAARILPFINGVKFQVVDSHLDLPTTYLQNFMEGAAGLYVPARRIVYVLRKGGLNNTIVLHEALHAATVSRIDTYLKLKAEGREIPAQLFRTIKELQETMDVAKERYDQLIEERLISGDRTVLTDDMLDIPTDAFDDIKEFVTYGMTFPPMQSFLLLTEGIYAGTSTDIQKQANVVNKLFTKFVQSIRDLFNMDATHTSALQDLIIISNKLLSPAIKSEISTTSTPSAAKAKKPKTPKAPAAPKVPRSVENLNRKIRFSTKFSELNKSIGDLYMQTRNAVDAIRLLKATYDSLHVSKLKLILPTLTTDDITSWAGDKINNLAVINSAVNDMAGMRVKLIRELAEKTPEWINFNKNYEEGGKALGDLMNMSTLLEVDPTKNPDLATALKTDSRLLALQNQLLNPATDPKSLPSIKGRISQRTAALKVIYEGGTVTDSVTKEKYNIKGWAQLGKYGKGEGQAIFKMAKDSYQDVFDMHEQLLIEKIAASNVPGSAKDASTPKGKLIASINKTFQEAKMLEIYFPLMRYGNFWFSIGKGKSGEFYMFESSVARNNAVEARVAELNKAGDNRTRDQLIADGDIDVGDDIRKLREKTVESSSMLKELFSMLDQNKLTDIEAIKDNIYQMYLMTLPEKDLRRKFTHRQGKTGFSADVLRNFIVTQHTAANQLSRLKYADAVRTGIAASYAEIANNPDKLRLSAFIREISSRAINEITPNVPTEDFDWNAVATIGNKFVFYWLLTSPKSALVQMTQLPIVGLPTLGAKFGIGKTLAVAARYSKLWNKFGLTKKDNSGNIVTEWGQPSIADSSYIAKHKNPAYKKVLTDAWNYANERDIFMSTYAGDMYAMSAAPTSEYNGKLTRATRAVFNFTSGAFHHSERISREIMFMSAFELAYEENISKGMGSKDAADNANERALKLTYDALFNYTQYNKPRVMKSAGGRLAFQFLTYPIQMTSYLVRNFYGMLPLLNKSEKKEAAIKFFGTLGMTGLFAGVTGFPLYSLIMGIAEGIREAMRPGMGEDNEEEVDEDYDEDADGNPLGKRSLDLWFRNWCIPHFFGDGSNLASILNLTDEQASTLARAVEMGPISSYFDLNVGASTSLDGLWFRNDKPAETSREAFMNFAFSFTGPIGSVGANMFGAFDDFNNGQVNRGFEKLSPAWLRGGLTAIRLKKEGATTTTGDEIMNAEFYTTGKLLAQTLGFASTEVAQVQKANFMAKQMVIKIQRESKALLNRLDVAVRSDNDPEDKKLDKVLFEIDKFNRKNPMLAIEGETISNSLQSRAKRRGKAYQGISVSDKEAPFVYPLVEGTRSPAYK